MQWSIFTFCFAGTLARGRAPSALTCRVSQAASAKLGHGMTLAASVCAFRTIYKIRQKKPSLGATARLNVHVINQMHDCMKSLISKHYTLWFAKFNSDLGQKPSAGPIYESRPCEMPAVHHWLESQCSCTCDIVITPEIHFNVIPLQHHAVLHAGLCNGDEHIILWVERIHWNWLVGQNLVNNKI